MTQNDAVAIIKGRTPDCSLDEIRNAWQFLVDNGTIWQMDLKLSRMAACMLSAGVIERNEA
jgi:hypothetical protein